jgi:hypothetical protein
MEKGLLPYQEQILSYKLFLLEGKFGFASNKGYRIGFELFIPMFTESPQGQVKVTEKILELIS